MKRFVLAFALFASLLAAPAPLYATAVPYQATQFAGACASPGFLSNTLGLDAWYSCLQLKYYPQASPLETAPIEIRELNDIWLIVLPLLGDAVRIAGYLAVGFVMWGGIKYLKSQGNPSELTQARDIIKNAIIGLLWTMLAVALVDFITRGLVEGKL